MPKHRQKSGTDIYGGDSEEAEAQEKVIRKKGSRFEEIKEIIEIINKS